ncbi:MAG: alkaline phosphatase [Aquabacterium sp.]|nr:MAG: alkaline phosphatase [Aquabacterium sp.]
MSKSEFNRRRFIRGIGAGMLVAPAIVRAAVEADSGATFAHGVASGDPLADKLVIWTRVSPALGAAVPVNWDVAADPGFTRMLRRGRAIAAATSDHTVKVDVPGLPADTTVYYRFQAGGQYSPVGRGRTLPVGAVQQVKLIVLSCSNYPAGYFNVYAEAAKVEGVHAALHLGDYIYEYPRGGYASADAASMGREVDPSNEILTLSDYRRRYAQYRTDLDLQALHAALPFICVWDDHEIANDTWKDGAENHDAATEGSFAARRAAAIRAYHEWMPIRAPHPTALDRIYRSFAFGNLVDLHMLDTRLIARDQQLDYANYIGASGFDATRFATDMANPSRQMIGAEQMQWLSGRLASTSATWTLLGQQILMGRMNIPAPLVLGQISFTAYSALVYKAQTAPATLTPQEQAILAQPAIPYNLDAWDGYAVARETLLGTVRAFDKNLVVLAGDTHNAWASDLLDLQGNQVGVEFATPGVTSPGLEEYFPNENPAAVAAGLTQIIGPLQYAQTKSRGFLLVTATPQECRADWRFVSTVKSQGYSAFNGTALRTLPGSGARRIVAA